jgi:uncharacterized alkaline shock family protein YloU
MTETQPDARKGKTMIAPDVLLTIARLTTLNVPGVARLASTPPTVDKLFQRSQADGVRIEVRGQTVTADIFVVASSGVLVRDVARQIQTDVARAIQEMVGMEVATVNVHVEDVDYSEAPAA